MQEKYEYRVLKLLMLCCAVLFAPLVLAEKLEPPQQVINGVALQLKDILADNQGRLDSDPGYVYQLVDEILVPHMDFSRISSLVLGKYWRKATASEQNEFSAQFQRLLVRTYSTAFREFQDWNISYQPMQLSAEQEDVSVQTRVSRAGGPPVAVDYRMHIIEGTWKAYDVKIEGISLVTNYRTSFAKLARRGGMKGLIERITQLNNRRNEPQSG